MHSKKQFVNKAFLKSKKGFTLAEVLVTLAVIGIVAALTIPSLIQSIQDNQYKTAFKKTFSIIQQALIEEIEEDGGAFDNTNITYKDKIRDKLCEHLSCIKKCNVDDMSKVGQCYHAVAVNKLNGTVDGSALRMIDVDLNTSAILSDGTLICIYGDFWFWGAYPDLIGDILIDINGFKKPNTFGKDIFLVYIDRKKGLIPAGSAMVGDDTTNCTSNGTGYNCATKVLTNTDY